ncbi:MAG: alpha/beta hydrolase [Cytophagaceae bacterium]
MHTKKIVSAGRNLEEAEKVLIMIHGRGALAHDILSLSRHLEVKDFALIAPQATNNTWYPLSFLAPPGQNEPWLSSALTLLGELVKDIEGKGIKRENIFFLGFSQGACLTLEFCARNADKWGGVIAFTGGLIGDKIYAENYHGSFEGTPVYIGTSDPDPHVPVDRVYNSVEILKSLKAEVTVEVFKNLGHTINQDEIDKVNSLIFKSNVYK